MATAIALSPLAASAYDNDRYGHGDAGQYAHGDRLSSDQRRALNRFNEQKHRDYRRLGQQHFQSDRERERAYRQLRQKHRDRLRSILGDRFDEERFHREHDDDRWEHSQSRRDDDRHATRAFDPASVAASTAARWALSETDQDELADALEDYQDDRQELREEDFDSAEGRREARRELEEDYRDNLKDILDDAADVDDIDVGDILDILHQD